MKVSDKVATQIPGTELTEGASRSKKAKDKTEVGKTSVSGSHHIGAGDETSSAKVKLSERAQEMKKIKEAVHNTPDVDEAKVAKFKSMLAKGEYKVDAEKVADKMVEEHAYNKFFNGDD